MALSEVCVAQGIKGVVCDLQMFGVILNGVVPASSV